MNFGNRVRGWVGLLNFQNKMKLKYKIDSEGKKVYTLDENNSKDAHYKFIKVRDAPKSNPEHFRRN